MAKFITAESMAKRIENLYAEREKMLDKAEELHVRLQKGNRKTGTNCWTTSTLPVVDCQHCKKCWKDCYDLKSDMIYSQVINDRCRNSAIHFTDPKRYWEEVDLQVKANFVRELRINVGGDLEDWDFDYVAELGRKNPKVKILFFTKNYEGINKFLDENEFPENVHPIMSAWMGLKMENPHHLPEAHVLYEDGTTTAPKYGAVYCGGNCSECAFKDEGCWTLKRNEHVIFKVH